jgi:hypothetical protein
VPSPEFGTFSSGTMAYLSDGETQTLAANGTAVDGSNFLQPGPSGLKASIITGLFLQIQNGRLLIYRRPKMIHFGSKILWVQKY